MFPHPRRLALALAALGVARTGLAQEAPPPAPPASPTLRESIDQARTRLAEALFGLQASAFADALSGYNDDGRRTTRFDAAEVDLSGDLTRDLQAAMALVSDRDATRLGVGFLDYHPFGGGIAPRGQLWVEKGFHVQVGRFDVPFGNDWQFYASKDSISISRPLTTDAIMDGGYNDAGLRILGNNGTVNFNAFLLRGFHPGRLLGGRIGLTPFGDPFTLSRTRDPKVAEIGLSWFYDAASDWRKRETGLAADAEGRVGRYYARAEYLVRTREPDPQLGGALTRRGWQLTQELSLQDLVPWPATLFARLERVACTGSPAQDQPLGRETRVAAGLSATFKGVLQVKLEGQHDLASSTLRATPYGATQWFAQLVVVL